MVKCKCGCNLEIINKNRRYLKNHQQNLFRLRRLEKLKSIGWYKGKLCKCGCNLEVTEGRIYISGHNKKGRHFKPFTKEHLEKLSISHKGKVSGRKGKKHTEETKQKLSKLYKGKTYKEIHGEEKSKIIINKLVIKRRNLILPLKDTKPEIKIQNFLKELNIEFIPHKYINIEHEYQCDIFIPNMNLIIECDGDYWHGNIKIKYNKILSQRQLKQKEKDKIRTKEVIEQGYNILRLWQQDINKMDIETFNNIILYGRDEI